MDSTTAALIGAAIGAFAGLIGHIVNNWLQGGREKKKELRERIAELASVMGAAQQSMDWISWCGVNYPHPKGTTGEGTTGEGIYKPQSTSYEKMIEGLASSYVAEMKAMWPKILGAIAAVASYDYKLYGELYELAKELARLDIRVTKATMKTEMHCRSDFEQLYDDIRGFAKRWMDDIASLMRAIGYKQQNPSPTM